MKKNCLKLFLPFFILLVFIVKVDAALVCNPDDEEVTITETGITDAGFDVTLPVCRWVNTGTFRVVGDPYPTRSEAYNSGMDTEIRTAESYDGKNIVNESVPRCSDPSRYVSASVKCTKKVDAVYHSNRTPSTCGEKAKADCTGRCSWDDSANICMGDNGSLNVYYECPSGYEPTGHLSASTECSKTETYPPYGNVAEGEDVVANAVSKCGADCTCEAEFSLNCPVYRCEREYRTLGACTPDFQIDGQPAYCVNPSQKFNGGRNNYQYDSSFNVLECASSYSTVDCGYANILIEGAYYDTSDDAINTALRLWSIHSGQAGDQKTGLANVSGPGCNEVTFYMSDESGNNVNVYKKTHDYIMDIMKEKFYEVAKKYDHIPPETNGSTHGVLNGNTFEKIACLTTSELNNQNNPKIKTMRGVMCGDDSDYRVGFELYFNTLIGNKYMKEHLSTLYGGGNGVKPTGALIKSEHSTEEETSSTSKKSWIEVSFEHESFWNYIEDEEIECGTAKLEELKNKLIANGKSVQEAETIINEIKPYCQVKVSVVDEDGKVLVTEKEMRKCIKGSGCRTVKFEFAVCDITENNEKDIEIKVMYERTDSSYSVRKYYSCSNANVNQTLFAFFKEDGERHDGSSHGDPVEVGRDITEETYSVTNYKCAGGCDNSSLRTEGNGTCENNQNNYNGVYSSKVKDPSLKCIVNLNDTSAKTRYDYSNYFNVNTNFCRVYCSDEVEYIVADKVKALSGRSFSYDIEFAAKGTNKLNYKLTSVVKEKRSCVSEIYYNHLQNVEVFKNEYGLTNSEFAKLKESKTFAGLFNILKEKASKENEREEILNQLIYDIYNCNFYSKDSIKSAGVDIPKNYTSTLIKKVKDIYGSSNDFGLGSNKDGIKTEGNTNINTVKYAFGASIKDTNSRVDNIRNTSILTGKLSNISYCKDETGNMCYDYDSNHDDISYNYPSNKGSKLKTYTLFKGKNVKVPTNDYARFEVTSEINFYNNNKYQVDYGSGKVYVGNSNTNLLTLDSYSYPIDKNAYNLDACNTSIENGKYHRCTVTQYINPLMFYRNDSSFKLTVNDENVFKCYVDVGRPSPACDPIKNNCDDATIYRNVDPSNLFPSGNTNVNSNWNTENGQRVKENIESSADQLKTNEKYLDYSITLSPNQIKNIKDYNNKNSSYSDELIYNCEKDPIDGIYYNCNSYFMDLLRGNTSEYTNGTYGNINADRKND